jgi:hypothetical protein
MTMSDVHPGHEHDADSFKLAAGMVCRWLASHYAGDDNAGAILAALRADPRTLAMALGALGEAFIQSLEKAQRDGNLEGSVQVWLDRLALNSGAEADAVVKRHRGDAAG